MIEKLKTKLEQLEKQKTEMEISFYQVAGAISFVNQLIDEINSDDTKAKDKK